MDGAWAVNGTYTYGELFTHSFFKDAAGNLTGVQGDTIDTTLWNLSHGTMSYFPGFKKQAISFKVTYNNNGGAGTLSPNPITYTDSGAYATTDGTSAGALPEAGFSKAGYTFAGWSTNSGATTPAITSAGQLSAAITGITNNGEYTLYAIWTKNPVVTYDLNGGSGGPSPLTYTVTGGSHTIVSGEPTRTGYTFDGWTRTGDTTARKAGYVISGITADITLVAKWVIKQYTITYNANASSGVTGMPSNGTVNHGSNYTVAGGPSRTGFQFDGWNTLANGSGTRYAASAVMSNVTANATLYAMWKPQVTFNGNKPAKAVSTHTVGNVPGSEYAPAGSAYTLPTTVPTLTGYTFAGWATNAAGTGTKYNAGTSAGTLTAATTFYATWTPKGPYTVNFYADWTTTSDGTAFATQSPTNWEADVTLPSPEPSASNVPTKAGYKFLGWFVRKNGTTADGFQLSSTTMFGNLWAGAQSVQGLTDAANTTVKLYANWQDLGNVTLTFNANGGTYGKASVTVRYGEDASIPNTGAVSNPTRPGYTFKGWADAASATAKAYDAGHTFAKMTSDKTVYAVWAPIDVTFVYSPGVTASGVTTVNTSNTTATAKYNATISLRKGNDVYTSTGYTFAGWQYTDTSGTIRTAATATAASSAINVSTFQGATGGTVTLTALWNPIKYTISWNANGGTNASGVSTSTNLNPDSNIPSVANPTRSGYTFTGWNTVANGSGSAVTAGSKVNAVWPALSSTTLTAYAQWKENIVEYIFHGDSNSSVVYGDGSALPSGGSVFVGAATGAIYASATATTPTANTIQGKKVMPKCNANYEFNASHGSKWSKGSATGTALTDVVNASGQLTVPTEGGLYTGGDFYVTVSPKWIAYSVEYYLQKADGSGYDLQGVTSADSGTAPFGYTVQMGSAAGTDDTAKTVTHVQRSFPGFTFVSTHPNGANPITIAASGNVLKLYYDRNTHNVTYVYVDAPAGVSAPAAQSGVLYGSSVTLPTVTAPDGYVWGGWRITSPATGTTITGTRFLMPDADVTVTGTWSKKTYSVVFTNSDSTKGSMTRTEYTNLPFGTGLSGSQPVPTVTPNAGVYFMGWQKYVNCTTAGLQSTGTAAGVMTSAEIASTWKIDSNTVFVALWGNTFAVNYVGGDHAGFSEKNGAIEDSTGTATIGGTRYTGFKPEVSSPMPGFGRSTSGTKATDLFDTGDRNQYNPKAAPGWKFVGWKWNDGTTDHEARGTYDAAGNFSAAASMPSIVNQSYTFIALWEKTWQQIHFETQYVGGVQSNAVTDMKAQIGDTVTLPTTTAATAPAGYTFLGWTDNKNYTSGNTMNNLTMTAGTQDKTVYTITEVLADGGYGITLYPVFKEITVEIKYVLAAGSTGRGTLSSAKDSNIGKATGSPAGSTATAKDGYQFKGWSTDANTYTPVDASWISGNKITPKAGSDNTFAAATYYAFFDVKDFDITFKVGANGTWNGTDTADKVVTLPFDTAYGSNVPSIVENSGYKFLKWMDGDGNSYTIDQLRAAKVPAKNMVFTAQYQERGFTVEYDVDGGTPVIGAHGAKWTEVLYDIMPSTVSSLAKQGYVLEGWYAKSGRDAASKIDTADTFAQGLAKAGLAPDSNGEATLKLYAKWVPVEHTIKYAPAYPGGGASIADKTPVIWTDSNLLGANATLSKSGYNFNGWNTKADGTGMSVTNATVFKDLYQNLFGITENGAKTITLYGVWGDKTYTVKFMEGANELETRNGVKWADLIDYKSYDPGDSKRLEGWSYTPAGGSATEWHASDGKLALSTLAGPTSSPENGAVFYLHAILKDNTKWQINFNKVGVDASGNPVMSTVTTLGNESGYVVPGTAIDIENFNGRNYITSFETPTGSSRRAELTGYALDKTVAGTKTTSTAGEATDGATIIFNVYWLEKLYTITYDTGRDAQGNVAADAGVTKPADKTAGWTSTDVRPGTDPTWAGHMLSGWQYRNSAGTLVTVTGTTKVSDMAANDNVTTITLIAKWETTTARITYVTQTGGTAASTDGAISVPENGSKFEDVDVVAGTPRTIVATANSGYIFEGWYRDGVLYESNPSLTVTKDGAIYATNTYVAHFRALDQIAYTIEHYFQSADGSTYEHRAPLNEVRYGQEFDTINFADDMKRNIKGFTHNASHPNRVHTISSLVNGSTLKLYYDRNQHDVTVIEAAPGADAPTPVPTPTYTATGITQAHTTHAYGTELTIPTMGAVNGWTFSWTISYTDSDTSTPTTITAANGDTFTMPDAAVTITGVWQRVIHKVIFNNGSDPHGTVTTTPGVNLPFNVAHGLTMNDPSATGNANDIVVTPGDKWAFSGWDWHDALGNSGFAADANAANALVINADTTFSARWSQTYFVAYAPGNHGGADFTSIIVARDQISHDDHVNANTIPLMIGGVDKTADAPHADGYRFIGWTWTIGGTTNYWIANRGDGLAIGSLTGTEVPAIDFTVESNVTFNAIWEAVEQSLVYNLNNNGQVPPAAWSPTGVAAGNTTDIYAPVPQPRTDETITLIDGGNLSRAGYRFTGWRLWTDANGDGVITDNELASPITGNFTMPAHGVVFVPAWDFESVSVRYAIAAGSEAYGSISSQRDNIVNAAMPVLKGSTATALPGYKFVGWYSDFACTTEVDASWISDLTNTTATIKPHRPDGGWVEAVYYARFAPDKADYTIEYYLQREDGSYTMAKSDRFSDIDTEQLADVTDPANAASAHKLDTSTGTYKAFTFNDTHGSSVLRSVVKGDGSTVLKLYYDLRWFNITYDLGGGAWTGAAGPSTAVSGSNVTIPGAKLTGMSLSGWTYSWTDETGATQTGTAKPSFTMPSADVHAVAVWSKNLDFVIEVYKADYDASGNLIATPDRIPTPQWNKQMPFEIGEGAVVTIVPNSDRTVRLMLSGNAAQGVTLPESLTIPFVGGYGYSSICDALGVYRTDIAETVDGHKVLKIYLAPATDYVVKYILQIDGTDVRELGSNTVVFATTNLGYTGTISGLEGYEFVGWTFKDKGGNYWPYTDSMSYADVVNGIYGSRDSSIKEIKLYTNVKPRAYKVTYADDTNGTVDPAIVVTDKSGFGWTAPVALDDPETLASYHKDGYKWMGWEARPASGSAVFFGPGDSLTFNRLAAIYGLNDATASNLTLYAVWTEWLPVTIEFYTKELDGTENKHGENVTYTADDKVVLNGQTFTVPQSLIDGRKPLGYAAPGAPSHVVRADDPSTWIFKVVYTAMTGFKLLLNDNYGENPIIKTVSGLTWNEKVDPKVTYAPTRMGYRLMDKPQRWNTKSDGTGYDLDANATYADIAAWIHKVGLNDTAILHDGLMLYAQWTLANDFEVLYDLNNDKNTNNKVLTEVPDERFPIDVNELNVKNVGWHDSGFDKSNDEELDAAPNGYEFDGWNTAADGSGLKIDNTMTYETICKYLSANAELASITLYAQWKELIVEIVYMVDDAEHGVITRERDKISAVTGTPVSDGSSDGTQLHSVATAKRGWHFVEWVLSGANENARLRSINTYLNGMRTHGADNSEIEVYANGDGRLYNATYVARFERNADALIKYDANGGQGMVDPQTAAYGTFVTVSDGSPLSRGHHTLAGWTTNPDGTGDFYALGHTNLVMPAEGLTLYAYWNVNSYGVKVNDPVDGGSVQKHGTTITWGENIPQEYVDSLMPWPDRGWSFSGWEYKMIDADTGEVVTGFTTNPTELVVLGEIELTPVFEGAPIVDGPPRTGDAQDFGMIIMLLLAAAALVLFVVIIRMRREKSVEEVEARKGAHSKQAVAARKAMGAHSVKAVAARKGAGAHSVTRAEAVVARKGAHSIEAVAARKAAAVTTAAGAGAHSVASGRPVMVSASTGAHSMKAVAARKAARVESAVVAKAAEQPETVVAAQPVQAAKPATITKAVEAQAAPTASVDNVSVVDFKSEHDTVREVACTTVHNSASEDICTTIASEKETPAYKRVDKVSNNTHAQELNEVSNSNSDIIVDQGLIAPPAPVTKSPRAAASVAARVGSAKPQVSALSRFAACVGLTSLGDKSVQKRPVQSVSHRDFDMQRGVLCPETGTGQSSASAVVEAPTLKQRLVQGVAALALSFSAVALVIWGMPAPAMAAEDVASTGTSAPITAQKAVEASEAIPGVSIGSDTNTGSSGAQTPNTGLDSSTHANGDAEQGSHAAVEGDQGAQSGDKAAEHDTANNESTDASEGSEGDVNGSDKDAEAGAQDKDASADTTHNEDAANNSENGADSSENSSDRGHDDGENDSDSAMPELPAVPTQTDSEPAPSSNAGIPESSIVPPFSGDDVKSASILAVADSTSPPPTREDFSPPLEEGKFFIQWESDPNFSLGSNENKIEVFYKAQPTNALLWQVSRVSFGSRNDVFTFDIGGYYLSRIAGSEDVELTNVLSDAAYWRLIIYTNPYNEVSYYVTDIAGIDNEFSTPDALGAIQDDESTASIFCASYGLNVSSLGPYYRWEFVAATPTDWTIRYLPNAPEGSTLEGETLLTQVSPVDGATLSDCGFHRYGYTFVGWCTQEDGEGTVYAPGQLIRNNEFGEILFPGYIMNLYAKWVKSYVHISFGTSGSGMISVGGGEDVTQADQVIGAADGVLMDTVDQLLQGVAVNPEHGFHFVGWLLGSGQGEISELMRYNKTLTTADILNMASYVDPETGWTLYRDLTFIADFAANTYKIVFDLNGGSGIMDTRTVTYGDTNVVTNPGDFSRPSYVFKGWNTKPDGSGIAVTDADTLEQLLAAGVLGDEDGAAATLYAIWEEAPASDNGASDSWWGSGDAGNDGSYSPYRYRGGSSALDIPTAEAAEMLDVAPVSDEKIKTRGTGNSFIDGITEFFSSDTGKIVGWVLGIALLVALIAAIAAVATHVARSRAAGAAGAGGAEATGGFFSRLRKRIANFFGRGEDK